MKMKLILYLLIVKASRLNKYGKNDYRYENLLFSKDEQADPTKFMKINGNVVIANVDYEEALEIHLNPFLGVIMSLNPLKIKIKFYWFDNITEDEDGNRYLKMEDAVFIVKNGNKEIKEFNDLNGFVGEFEEIRLLSDQKFSNETLNLCLRFSFDNIKDLEVAGSFNLNFFKNCKENSYSEEFNEVVNDGINKFAGYEYDNIGPYGVYRHNQSDGHEYLPQQHEEYIYQEPERYYENQKSRYLKGKNKSRTYSTQSDTSTGYQNYKKSHLYNWMNNSDQDKSEARYIYKTSDSNSDVSEPRANYSCQYQNTTPNNYATHWSEVIPKFELPRAKLISRATQVTKDLRTNVSDFHSKNKKEEEDVDDQQDLSDESVNTGSYLHYPQPDYSDFRQKNWIRKDKNGTLFDEIGSGSRNICKKYVKPNPVQNLEHGKNKPNQRRDYMRDQSYNYRPNKGTSTILFQEEKDSGYNHISSKKHPIPRYVDIMLKNGKAIPLYENETKNKAIKRTFKVKDNECQNRRQQRCPLCDARGTPGRAKYISIRDEKNSNVITICGRDFENLEIGETLV